MLNKMEQKPSPSASKKTSAPSKYIKDPVPASIPTTSREGGVPFGEKARKPCSKRFCNYLYNKDKKTFCNRTCKNWIYIIAYSLIYLIFLVTYTLIFLFGSLTILKLTTDFQNIDKVDLLTYSGNGIGLTATPSSESNYPLIWYRKGQCDDYEKYVNALDSLLVKKRRKRDMDVLGPCGKSPYGYGESPCVVVRVNKQLHWAGKPLLANSSETRIAPMEVQRWLKQEKKLWFHCNGHHAYDREHVGRIRYFPHPPGIDPSVFPLKNENSPLIAIQISNFTIGLSIAIQCKLWYVDGPSSVNFMMYVAMDDKVSNRFNYVSL